MKLIFAIITNETIDLITAEPKTALNRARHLFKTGQKRVLIKIGHDSDFNHFLIYDLSTETLKPSTNDREDFLLKILKENDQIKYFDVSKEDISDRELEKRISKFLIDDNIRTHLLGFDFLKTAIKMVLKDRSYLQNVTKGLYPDGAKEHNTTPSRFERAIRHALSDRNIINAEYISDAVEVLKYES